MIVWIAGPAIFVSMDCRWTFEMDDTLPEIAEMVRQRYRTMSPGERFRIGAEMFETARTIMLGSFPAGLEDNERRRLMVRHLYGDCFDHVYKTTSRTSCPACPESDDC